MANFNLKFTKTLKMKAEGVSFHCEHFPERSKVLNDLYRRRRLGKPIDGSCFQSAGEALKEMKKNGIR